MTKKWYILGLVVLLVVFAVLVITVFLVPKFYGDPKSPSEFGDMFGAANAIFSGLAFAGVIYTLLLQRADLLATQKLSIAGMLFEYYNAKISSLRTAQARSEDERQRLQPQVDELVLRHHAIKDELEHLYAQLLARPGGN